ncbi:unnamed protein product [Urochloa humidicola]
MGLVRAPFLLPRHISNHSCRPLPSPPRRELRLPLAVGRWGHTEWASAAGLARVSTPSVQGALRRSSSSDNLFLSISSFLPPLAKRDEPSHEGARWYLRSTHNVGPHPRPHHPPSAPTPAWRSSPSGRRGRRMGERRRGGELDPAVANESIPCSRDGEATRSRPHRPPAHPASPRRLRRELELCTAAAGEGPLLLHLPPNPVEIRAGLMPALLWPAVDPAIACPIPPRAGSNQGATAAAAPIGHGGRGLTGHAEPKPRAWRHA